MKLRPWLRGVGLTVALAAGVALPGCEKDVREAKAKGDKPQPAVPTQPVTQPTDAVLAADPEFTTLPETKPAEPEPVLTFLMIDGLGAHFPPTKLLLHEDGGRVRAELCSDLPKSAIKDYAGNELYLEMDLAGGNGPDKIEGATWRFKSTSSERTDTTNGIFLDGQRRKLQPDDVMVKFERRGDQLLAQIMGQFRGYEPGTPDALAPFVVVRGELTVGVVENR